MERFMDIVIYLLIIVLSYWIIAVIHELGHVIVGLAHGWKLLQLVVGFIGLKRKDGRLVLYFEKNPAMWLGIGGAFPVQENKNNINIWSKTLLGGPAASISACIIFLALGLLTSISFILFLGIMSVPMVIMCLLPLKTSIMYTDIKRWRRLHDGGRGEAEEIALFKMMEFEQLKKDNSLRRKEDFEALLEAELPSLRYYGNYYLYKYYVTRNDEEGRLKTLEVLNDMKKSVSKAIIDDCGV